MNFDSESPIDTLIGRLLAFIIMFEKKIEIIKCKLAGNEQFHTRLAFQMMDYDRKNQITSTKLYQALRNVGSGESEAGCQCFIRKYSKNGALSYEEFLKLLTPKGNKILSQRMMIRTFRRGAQLEDYLYKMLMELMMLYGKMSIVTEQIRRGIQQNEDVSSVQIIQFFHQRINSPDGLITFFSLCGEQQGQQYDVSRHDAVYLSYHVSSGNDLSDFTDMDIKQLIFPLDMNYQKYTKTKDGFNKIKTMKEQNTPAQTNTTNFLGKTYQKMYPQLPVNTSSDSKKENYQPSILKASQIPLVLQADKYITWKYGADRSSFQNSYGGGLYIDNFARSDLHEGLQIDRFLSKRQRGFKGPVEVFVDELKSNGSSISKDSRQSAFDRS